jgi:hypothetical protein
MILIGLIIIQWVMTIQGTRGVGTPVLVVAILTTTTANMVAVGRMKIDHPIMYLLLLCECIKRLKNKTII